MKTIKCDSKETYRNKKNNTIYASKEEAQQDVDNPETETKQEDIACDVNIIVPPEAFAIISKTKDED
tara:strand:+ start:1431 stop:1631 length:201 start_codon:yes stop_codon:yes gene_type:complete